eukprot:TRINITY_DN6148_c0_g1_i1.p4 TRINITY_DN6148_c0_g1~~TRINITY_DN6148_c0_g1_i1.p4  ORF type:complete len:262 (+),score=79.70 TRINITY_DN6148_c0_g1_i1:463-1248(+)
MFGAMSLQLGAAAEERREGDRSRSTGRNVTAGRRARNGPGGERQQREETSDEVRRLVGLIGRLSLLTALKTDVVMGAVTDVTILTEETVTITIGGKSLALNAAVKDAMKAYTEQAKKLAQSEKQKAGPPHVRVRDTMLTFMERHAEESKEGAEMLKMIKNHRDEVAAVPEKMRVAAVGSAVRIARVQKNYQKGSMRVEIMVTDAEEMRTAKPVWLLVIKYMLGKCKGDLRQGKAPQSGLQRRTEAAMRGLSLFEEAEQMED